MSVATAIVRAVTILVLTQLILEVFTVAPIDRSISIQYRHTSDAPLDVFLGSRLERLVRVAYRVLPKSTLCFGESV